MSTRESHVESGVQHLRFVMLKVHDFSVVPLSIRAKEDAEATPRMEVMNGIIRCARCFLHGRWHGCWSSGGQGVVN